MKFWNVSGVPAMYRGGVEYFCSFWHVSGVNVMFREFLECFGSFWYVSAGCSLWKKQFDSINILLLD